MCSVSTTVSTVETGLVVAHLGQGLNLDLI